jgi:threonine dehydratase
MASCVLDTVVVPLGNGALISGVATWIKHVQPAVRVVGVASEGADSMEASWRTNTVVERASVDTIADGIAVRTPVPEALDDMRGVVDDVVLVSESSIHHAMRMLFSTSGIVGEPAGVAGIAGLIEHKSLRIGRLATIVCGSNLTDEQLRQWLVA